MYLGGTTVAWMTVLLLIAEPLHRTGKFTLGDTVALRLPRQQRPVRVALAVCVLASPSRRPRSCRRSPTPCSGGASARRAPCSASGGLLCSVLPAVFSPVVSSAPGSFYPGVDFAWFPLQNPGIVSIPVGFLLGRLGTVLDKGPAEEPAAHEEFEVRMLVGAED
ncbi:hypothetical protein [Streptomyces sp. WAC04114]|uniref:hypothetical protein n=1 Tax=Streptomyces sp. WAC04114 TaxID=2867961 RepID=UPI0035ABA3DF